MSDREKMIAIFDALPKNTTFEEVADRLIEAGFGIVGRLDLSKRKSVQPNDLLEMVKIGVKPILVCNKTIDSMGIESPWELGMYARLKSICRSSVDQEGYEITVDLVEFSDINDGMACSGWWMKGGKGLGTCKEAGWWRPEDTILVPKEDFELEIVE